MTEVARALKRGVGTEVEGVFEGLLDLLVSQSDDPFGFGALAVGVAGRGAVSIPPPGAGGVWGQWRGIFVAKRVAKHPAAFIDMVLKTRVAGEGVRVGEIDDGRFFQSLEAGLVLNGDGIRRAGDARKRARAATHMAKVARRVAHFGITHGGCE